MEAIESAWFGRTEAAVGEMTITVRNLLGGGKINHCKGSWTLNSLNIAGWKGLVFPPQFTLSNSSNYNLWFKNDSKKQSAQQYGFSCPDRTPTRSHSTENHKSSCNQHLKGTCTKSEWLNIPLILHLQAADNNWWDDLWGEIDTMGSCNYSDVGYRGRLFAFIQSLITGVRR